jgi:trehalose-phosphatase
VRRRPGAKGDVPDPTTALREATARVVDLLRGRPPLLVLSDFDGTLSPIVREPMGAVIEPLAKRALGRLARIAAARPGRLSVVMLSGRTALDLAGRVRVGGVRYFGNHGVESGRLGRRGRAERLSVAVEPALEPYVAIAERVADDVVARLGSPSWLFVERKGPTVAFHFRQASDTDAARVAVIEAIEAAEAALGGTGLVQLEGRRIVELRPHLAGGKGEAAQRLIAELRPGAVLTLGDDVSDAEAFDAVRRARERGELDGLAVAVHGAAETPHTVVAAADVELARPRDAARLLSALATALEAEPTKPTPRPR